MKAVQVLIAILLISCTQTFLGEPRANDAVSVFDEFWKGIDTTWPEFATKHVDWDSLYTVYRAQINPSTSEAQLLQVLKDMSFALRDSHTSIYPGRRSAVYYNPPFPKNFYGFNWIQANYRKNFQLNNTIAYGQITPEVGYIYISNFFSSPDQFVIIDKILNDFRGLKGIIVDVRGNGGGNTDRSLTIASRFVDKPRVYESVRFRLGKNRTQMSDLQALRISPAGTASFSGKVALLTNRYSYSATEDFVLMMRSSPLVIQIGDNTGGGSGSKPILKELPNGWSYRVSSQLTCDPTGMPISQGIVPDILVQTLREDSLKGKDTIIERAILELLN